MRNPNGFRRSPARQLQPTRPDPKPPSSNPADAPRIDPARWELCGTDAYVWGPIAYPKKTGRTLSGP